MAAVVWRLVGRWTARKPRSQRSRFCFIAWAASLEKQPPTRLRYSVITTRYSSACYLHLASPGRNTSTVWANRLPKGSRANSAADLVIEPGIPAPGPPIHLREALLSLLRELPALQMRRKENSKGEYTKQKFRLPLVTAPCLQLLECHRCILTPHWSIVARARGTDSTESHI